jgi:hypothetical protein
MYKKVLTLFFLVTFLNSNVLFADTPGPTTSTSIQSVQITEAQIKQIKQNFINLMGIFRVPESAFSVNDLLRKTQILEFICETFNTTPDRINKALERLPKLIESIIPILFANMRIPIL